MEKFTKALVAFTTIGMEDINVRHTDKSVWVIDAKFPQSGVQLGKIREFVETLKETTSTTKFSREGIVAVGEN